MTDIATIITDLTTIIITDITGSLNPTTGIETRKLQF